jgi:hypothetical protein
MKVEVEVRDYRPVDEAEDAYRVGESRSNYPSAIPSGRTAIRDRAAVVDYKFSNSGENKTPHLAFAQAGRCFAPLAGSKVLAREYLLRV